MVPKLGHAIIKKNTMTINLKELTIPWIDGSEQRIEFGKHLAQAIFENTQSVAEHSLSLELYKTGEVENTEENKDIIRKYAKSHFKAFIQLAVEELLK